MQGHRRILGVVRSDGLVRGCYKPNLSFLKVPVAKIPHLVTKALQLYQALISQSMVH